MGVSCGFRGLSCGLRHAPACPVASDGYFSQSLKRGQRKSSGIFTASGQCYKYGMEKTPLTPELIRAVLNTPYSEIIGKKARICTRCDNVVVRGTECRRCNGQTKEISPSLKWWLKKANRDAELVHHLTKLVGGVDWDDPYSSQNYSAGYKTVTNSWGWIKQIVQEEFKTAEPPFDEPEAERALALED